MSVQVAKAGVCIMLEMLFHSGEKAHATSTRYHAGDVVTVYIDTVLGTLTWAINGEMVEFKYTNIRGKVLYPAVTLYYSNDEVTIGNMKSESDTSRVLHEVVKREFELASNFFDSNDFAVSAPTSKTDRRKRAGELVEMFYELNHESGSLKSSHSVNNDKGDSLTVSSPSSKRHKSIVKAMEVVGDIGDLCTNVIASTFDGSFDKNDHLVLQSSKLCENAQKVVCAQGALWQLSIISQTIHTANALQILYARKAALRLLQLSKYNASPLLLALSGDVESIFRFCQLFVASSKESEIILLGEYMRQILKQNRSESNSLSRAVLAESIFVLMRSICTMNSVYKGSIPSSHLDLVDDKSAIKNPNPKFGFWLLRTSSRCSRIFVIAFIVNSSHIIVLHIIKRRIVAHGGPGSFSAHDYSGKRTFPSMGQKIN